MPRVGGWFRTYRDVNRATRVHDNAIFGRALRAVRHYYTVHFYVQVLSRTGIDQPRLFLAILLLVTKKDIDTLDNVRKSTDKYNGRVTKNCNLKYYLLVALFQFFIRKSAFLFMKKYIIKFLLRDII